VLPECAAGGQTAEPAPKQKAEQVPDGFFAIPVVNNTPFDIELGYAAGVVPAHTERTVVLPRYTGEVDGGCRLTYRVNLLDGVYITIRRAENVIVAPGQKRLVIENAVFASPETFVVLRNRSIHTVKVRSGAPFSESYRVSLDEAGDERRYGSANIAADASALFDNIPSRIALSVESDNYQTRPFPVDDFTRGFRYVFVFDGAEVTLADMRPLCAIGQPIAAAVAFDGAIPESDRDALRKALNDGLAANNAPLRVLPGDGVFVETDEAGESGKAVFSIAVAPGTKAPAPPLNRELHTGEVTVTLSRADRVIVEHKAVVTEFDEAGVYRALCRFLAGDARLYREIAEGTGDFR
jgi:hypothetical protein